MLEIEGLCIHIDDVPILREVSLQVAQKEIVTVIGPNGAGKSTMLKAIVNLSSPSQGKREGRGRILFGGASIWGLSPEETVRLGISIVPEGARVFPEMSVLDNLRMSGVKPWKRSFSFSRGLRSVYIKKR